MLSINAVFSRRLWLSYSFVAWHTFISRKERRGGSSLILTPALRVVIWSGVCVCVCFNLHRDRRETDPCAEQASGMCKWVIYPLVGKERFGSCELHLPSHQFITEFPTRCRIKEGEGVEGGGGQGGWSTACWQRSRPLPKTWKSDMLLSVLARKSLLWDQQTGYGDHSVPPIAPAPPTLTTPHGAGSGVGHHSLHWFPQAQYPPDTTRQATLQRLTCSCELPLLEEKKKTILFCRRFCFYLTLLLIFWQTGPRYNNSNNDSTNQ